MIRFFIYNKDNNIEMFQFDDRKTVIKFLNNGYKNEYKNCDVVVVLDNGERFNLKSERAAQYFGIRGLLI